MPQVSDVSDSSDDDREERVNSLSPHDIMTKKLCRELCCVCNIDVGGRLLLCSTCNFACHFRCVRPPLENFPQEAWSCPFCIVARANNGNSETVKKATVGVQRMSELKSIFTDGKGTKQNKKRKMTCRKSTPHPLKSATASKRQRNI